MTNSRQTHLNLNSSGVDYSCDYHLLRANISGSITKASRHKWCTSLLCIFNVPPKHTNRLLSYMILMLYMYICVCPWLYACNYIGKHLIDLAMGQKPTPFQLRTEHKQIDDVINFKRPHVIDSASFKIIQMYQSANWPFVRACSPEQKERLCCDGVLLKFDCWFGWFGINSDDVKKYYPKASRLAVGSSEIKLPNRFIQPYVRSPLNL